MRLNNSGWGRVHCNQEISDPGVMTRMFSRDEMTQSWAQTISCNLPSLDTLRLPPPANLQNTRLKMLQQLLCKFPRYSPPLLFVQQSALFCSYFEPGCDDAALCCVELTAYYFLAIKIPTLLDPRDLHNWVTSNNARPNCDDPEPKTRSEANKRDKEFC